MKQKISNIAIYWPIALYILTICALAFMSFQSRNGVAAIWPPFPKVYSVSLTTDQWNSRLQTINAAKEIMRKSTLPSNVISQYSDSLSVMAQDISEQVGMQLQQEQKRDSTSKPKK